MNSARAVRLARRYMPEAEVKLEEGWLRHHVTNLLDGNRNIGIELGVARGIFSKRMVESGQFQRFYGVDAYGDVHDTNQYCEALRHIGIEESRYCLLRMDFESALGIFEDSYFDFIYLDGYAHTGQEGGKTILDWVRKLKTGGVLAGDDYHDKWPLVKWAVNDLARQTGADVHVTTEVEGSAYSKYPTWFIVKKENSSELDLNPLLYKVAMKEKVRIHRLRNRKRSSVEKRIRSSLRAFASKYGSLVGRGSAQHPGS